jgi:diacylglycerol O-acyltransferase-1
MVILYGLVVFLKLYSYAHTNYVLRDKYFKVAASKKQDDLKLSFACQIDVSDYPKSLTFRWMFLFFLFPTLCYQLSYPRTDHINFQRVFAKCGLFAILTMIVYLIGYQYVYPSIVNSVQYLDDPLVNTPRLMERILKIAVPNLYLWLIAFYAFFDCFLSIIAELTYFGDAKFYGDWWNARTVGHYWNTWNLPVHNWIKRHILFPLAKAGYSKLFSMFACFLFSAFFHEYIFAVPFGLKGMAFVGIFAQVPLVLATDGLKTYHYLGNIIFWLSIALGQPFLIVWYYRDYMIKHGLTPNLS